MAHRSEKQSIFQSVHSTIIHRKFSLFFVLFAIGVIIANLLSVIVPNKSAYTASDFWDRYPQLRQGYLDSQYINKKAKPHQWIPDTHVNSYAGASYVKYGVSPILIAPDTPPLGRYVMGVSAVLFGNENILVFIATISSLGMLFLVGRQVFQNNALALIPPLFFSFEPLFKYQLAYTPLLDTMQLLFMLMGFYFFNRGQETKKYIVYFVLASLSLGLFISTKFYITGIVIVGAWTLALFLQRKYKALVILCATLPISIVVLLLNYIQLLFQGYTFLKFLGVQKYVFMYHKSQLIHPFTIWPLLLFNKWYVWWGNTPIISEQTWMLSWPILTLNLIISPIAYFLKKIPQNKMLLPLLMWSILYVLFFSFGQIAARYFVILLPVLYILLVYMLREIVRKISTKK